MQIFLSFCISLFTAGKLLSNKHTSSNILARRFSMLITLQHQIRLTYKYLVQILYIYYLVDCIYFTLMFKVTKTSVLLSHSSQLFQAGATVCHCLTSFKVKIQLNPFCIGDGSYIDVHKFILA